MANKDDWNILLYRKEGGNIIAPSNNPTMSGRYICTCLLKNGEHELRYLQVTEYNHAENRWHDPGKPRAISHHILAWKNQDVCDFADFIIEHGIFYEKGL